MHSSRVPPPATPLAFLRQARTSFFLDAGDYPPPPPGDDCDGDGIPNTALPGGFDDDDGDGGGY